MENLRVRCYAGVTGRMVIEQLKMNKIGIDIRGLEKYTEIWRSEGKIILTPLAKDMVTMDGKER